MQTLDLGEYKVTFYPAGHIPGAMMMLFEYRGRRILYTGDYSIDRTPLAESCILPDGLNIDTMIMCGLHAKHPDYEKNSDGIYRTAKYILRGAERGRSVMCHISQLSKGVEFLKMINDRNTENVPVYIGNSIMSVVEKMERLSVPVLDKNDHAFNGVPPYKPHILLTSDVREGGGFGYERTNIVFSLHEDFGMMKEFIERVDPRYAYIVHSAPPYSPYDDTIEQIIMRDGECRTQFIFAEEKETYII